MVNNKDLIIPLLTFPKIGDAFYWVTVLQRKKDHKGERLGGSNNNSRAIKSYYINSLEKLEIHWEEMVKLAELFNARVSINLNPRSFEKAGFQLLSKVAHQMENRDFYNIRKAYDSVLGNYHSEMDKRWLVDLDSEDLDKRDEIIGTINILQNKILDRSYRILAIIPSKSGEHIITNPFNKEEFSKFYPNIDIHGNNPTLLYCP